MIFDKQSFLAGLHTGLRLGRDPINRMPPAPGGRYILTEYEINIVTEYEAPSGNQTIYDNGVGYQPVLRYPRPYEATEIGIARDSSMSDVVYPVASDAHYFMWKKSNSPSEGECVVIYSTEPSDIYNTVYTFYIVDPRYDWYYGPGAMLYSDRAIIDAVPNEFEKLTWPYLPDDRKVGNFYVYVFPYGVPGGWFWTDKEDHNCYYTIDGHKALIATSEKLLEILENAQPDPLITD